jgi:hypothetical protein
LEEEKTYSEQLEELKESEVSSVKSQKLMLHHQDTPITIDNDAAEFFRRINKKGGVMVNPTQD